MHRAARGMPYATALLNVCHFDLRMELFGEGTVSSPITWVVGLQDPSAAGGKISDCLGDRKLPVPTCRGEVAEATVALTVGGGGRVLTVELVYAAMAAGGTAWSREMLAKTMRRMTARAIGRTSCNLSLHGSTSTGGPSRCDSGYNARGLRACPEKVVHAGGGQESPCQTPLTTSRRHTRRSTPYPCPQTAYMG